MGSLNRAILGRVAIFVGSLAVLMPTTSYARDWPETAGWVIGEVEDGCGMMQEFEGKGDTQLYLFLTTDDQVMLSLSNTDWSAVKDQKYGLEFYLNGQAYSGAPSYGTGERYSSRKGFATKMAPSFLDDFAKGTGLKIYRGESVVDHLDLNGTSAAVGTLRRCLASAKSEKAAAEREEKRLAHISDNPFAVEQTEEEKAKFGERKPEPRTSPGAWLSDADYPSRAQREEREGTTGYKLQIGPDGRVTGCSVTSSSGHADLDEATCRLIPRRARFSGGSAGSYEGKQVWRLPQ